MDRPNTEQCAPASDQWRADNLAGFRIGDKVRLQTISSPLTVIDFQPPSLLVLESDRGHQLRAGWKVVTLVSKGIPNV